MSKTYKDKKDSFVGRFKKSTHKMNPYKRMKYEKDETSRQ